MSRTAAILGSGQVGAALAMGLATQGWRIVVGTHHPGKRLDWEVPAPVEVFGYDDAAQRADLAVLAVKGTVAEEVVRTAAAGLAGKTVLDTTNPISDAPPDNGVLKFFTTPDRSLLERLQQAVPMARFVKAFNSVGASLMVNPSLGATPSMFICGNDDRARAEVATIVRDFGWDVEDMGSAEAARAIEPLCMLWCLPGFRAGDWVHAFKVLRPR